MSASRGSTNANRLSWEPPGAGRWEIDRSHYPGGTTPIAAWLIEEAMPAGMKRVFAELGTPAETLECRFVNGFMYTRLRPLIGGGRSNTKLPPRVVLRVVTRVHPAFRACRAQVARTLRDRPWRAVIQQWHADIRPQLEQQNLGFQDVDLDVLDDAALAVHVESLLCHCRRTVELHFWLHGYDLGPIGLLLAECQGWGIEPRDVVAALEGASPSTSAPAIALNRIRSEVRASGLRPTTLAALRSVSPEVANQLDAYLRYRGALLFSRYDLDGTTLGEADDVVMSTVLDGRDHHGADLQVQRAEAAAAALRERVPAAQRARFDEWLAEARSAMDLRDDNGPNSVEWPCGLLRLAMLEVGRRLVAQGALLDVQHVFELGPDELVQALRRTGGPDALVLASRAAQRGANAALDPPQSLGPEEPTPPLDVLPDPLPKMIGAVNLVIEQMGMAQSRQAPRGALSGYGVGSQAYRGRARMADNADDAIMTMEPGDVLVVRFTTPAYNTVLGIAGAVVTSEGGPLSHAAVLARELGIPAVIGAAGAVELISDGDEVEVDPAGGCVRVLGDTPRPVVSLG